MQKFIERLEKDTLSNQLATVVALSTFAVAQPLYSVVIREGSFFVGSELTLPDGLFVLLIFSVLLPALLAALVALAQKISDRARNWTYNVLAFGLLAALFLPLFKELFITGKPPLVTLFMQLLISTALGTLVFFILKRYQMARSFMAWLSVCAIIFPLYFLFNYPFLKKSSYNFTPPAASKDIPVVLIIYDEFPMMSLLDDRRQIDPVLYPNFADFAKHATWYFRAFSSHTDTAHAVPAILSGQYPPLSRDESECLNPPTSSHHYSKNLFRYCPHHTSTT